MNSVINHNICIIGCGDIGLRVAKLYSDKNILGVVQSEKSLSRCNKRGIKAFQSDFDQYITLPKIAKNIFYFMPPPPTACEDTRIKQFLARLDKASKRIVLISTTGVYGDSNGEWINEETPVNPKADRAYRRLSAENVLKKWSEKTGSEFIILRVPGIYAEDRLPLARLTKGLPIVKADEAGWTNRIHADDLAQACKLAMECEHRDQIINVCDGSPSTMADYFNQVANFANLPHPPQISMNEAEETLSAGMVSYLKESRRISNQKLLTLLGIKLKYPDLSFLTKI